MTSPVIDAGDGLPLTVPALFARAGRRPTGPGVARLRRRHAHLWRGRRALGRAGEGAPHVRGQCRYARGDPAFQRLGVRRRLAGGCAHRRRQRSAQHVLDGDGARRFAPRCRRRVPARGIVVPVARLSHDPAGGHHRPRPRRAGAPAVDVGAVAPPDRIRRPPAANVGWKRAPWRPFLPGVRIGRRRPCGLDAARAARDERRHRRRRPRRGCECSHARGSHGDRAHVGLDQRAERRDPHARRAHTPPRQPERAPAVRARRDPVLELTVLLDRWLRLRVAGHVGLGGDAGVLELGRRGRCSGRPRARPADDGQRVRGVGRARAAGPELPVARSVVHQARQPVPDHAGRCAPPRPCPPSRHVGHDRGRQRLPRERGRRRAARAPSRVVRQVGAGARGRGTPRGGRCGVRGR